jgi:peptidoglycan/LPS O-acetylase OafA/YrhL
VVLFHGGLLQGGYIGVDLFFVLSGFLITTLLLEEHRTTGRISLKRFYERRARRILPALLVLLSLYGAVTAITGHDGARVIALAGFFSANVVQAFITPNPLGLAGLAHLWSLAEEEQFYALWPLLILVLARRPRLLVPALSLALALELGWRTVLALHGASWERIYYGPDSHADGLIAGGLLAVLLFQRRLRFHESLPVLAWGLLVVGAKLGPLTDLGWIAIWPFLLLGCVGMTAAAATDTRMAALLSLSPLVLLGRISYSLYLWHVAVMTGIYDWTGERHLVLAVVVSVSLAVLSYRYVEQPFRRRRGGRLAVAPSTT